MATIDHGKWEQYTPAEPLPGIPLNVMYARRESDHVDWYEYVNNPDSFQSDSVKLAIMFHDYAGAYIVGPATYDATAIFPANQIIREITDYGGTDPQGDLGGMVYDPSNDSFSVRPTEEPVPSPLMKTLETINARLARLEEK